MDFILRGSNVENDVKFRVSKYVSFLLRHDPEDLEMDEKGFVDLDELVSKVSRRFPMVDRNFIIKLVDESERRRFEIVENKIRALYGHTIPVHMHLKEDREITRLFHGTTPQAASEILEKGLQPMRRKWVHLSPTKEIAREVGKRRTSSPAILMIDASEARSLGVRFYRATDKVYLCKYVPAKYIKTLHV